MEEYSRILIEKYCRKKETAKSRRLQKLLDLSYEVMPDITDSDAYFLEKAIISEKNTELKKSVGRSG